MVKAHITRGRLLLIAGLAVLLAAALAGPAAAGAIGSSRASLDGGTAPLNPEYLDSLVRLPHSILAQALGGLGYGLRPGPQGDLTSGVADGGRRAMEAAAPSSLDLRASNRVTPVKNQGSYGTCWAFASCGSLESASMPGETLDLSEDNMVLTSGFSVGSSLYNAGGNLWMAAAYLTRWGGPVYESEDAYGDSYTPAGLSSRKHVQEVVLIPGRSSATDNEAIKSAVQQYGGAYVSMGWYGSTGGSQYYSASTGSYYYNGSDTTNHGVLIVGWDDAYPASRFALQPPGDGAFLVKNSWGSSWGLSGYFWVSYHDSLFGRRGEMAVMNGAQPVSNYAGVYQYDPLGDCNEYGFNSTTGWLANVFTAQADQSLSAVGFWAMAPGTTYEVYTGSSLSARTLATSGTFATMGFHTVQLPQPAQLTAGRQFVVSVKVVTPGNTYPIAFEAPYTGYSQAATAGAGQSYVSPTGSTWTDMTALVRNANVCLKAYVSASAPAPSGPVIGSFAPSSGAIGTAVTLTGTGFTGATAVRFNGTTATFSVTGDTRITTSVPAGATSGTVSVATPGGTATSTGSFTVTSSTPTLPTVTSFSPTSGPVGTVVSVNGTGFSGVTRVTFNGVSAAFTPVSTTRLTASVPAGASSGRIAVTTGSGTATSTGSFTVTSSTPTRPTVTSFSPTSGPVGTVVSVNGTGFSGVTRVTFNGVSAAFTPVSTTRLTASVPAGASSGRIAVTTPGGTATSVVAFAVLRF